MQLIADTHVHLYPSFDLERVFKYAVGNLSQHGPFQNVVRAIFLSERSGQQVYADLDRAVVPLDCGLRRRRTHDGKALWLEGKGERLLVCPGRQIVTAERIEVLSLLSVEEIPDGDPASSTLAKIRECGGVPVFPWSPGKWLGTRGKIVANLIKSSDPGSVLVGDTSMRPRGSKRPGLFRTARDCNMHIVAGTDPLPFSREVKMIGRYGISLHDGFNSEWPVESIRSCLLDPEMTIMCVGKRCNWPLSAGRWGRHCIFHAGPLTRERTNGIAC